MAIAHFSAEQMPWHPGEFIILEGGITIKAEIAEGIGGAEAQPISLRADIAQEYPIRPGFNALMDGTIQIERDALAKAYRLALDFIAQPRMIGRDFPGNIATAAPRADFKRGAALRIQLRKALHILRLRDQIGQGWRFRGPGKIAENLGPFRCLPQHAKARIDPAPITLAGIIAIGEEAIITFTPCSARGSASDEGESRQHFQAVFQIGIHIGGAIYGIGRHHGGSPIIIEKAQ